jgi:hypothetical protein
MWPATVAIDRFSDLRLGWGRRGKGMDRLGDNDESLFATERGAKTEGADGRFLTRCEPPALSPGGEK